MNERISILVPSSRGTLAQRLDDLVALVDDEMKSLHTDATHLLWSRLYLSDAANQFPSCLAHRLYTGVLSQGAFSYVQQAPLCGSKVALLVSFAPDNVVTKSGTPDRMAITCGTETYLYQSVRLSADEAAPLDARAQTLLCFNRHIDWLHEQGLSLSDDCMRTWLYVRDIDRHYHDVVEARNEIFRAHGLTRHTHYIASTGINGGQSNGQTVVGIDFLSVSAEGRKVSYLQAPAYLNPTYQYGVAFERGTALTVGGRKLLFISGTASIDREGRCLYQGDVIKQTDRLLLNIDHLLADGGAALADLAYLIVYLRDPSDYAAVNAHLGELLPHIPRLVTLAPVCRPEWLIECEGVAIKR